MISDKKIKGAVKWWSKFLYEDFENDNGGGLQSVMMNIRLPEKQTLDKIIKFEQALTKIIKDNLKKSSYMYIFTDYDACEYLVAACEAAEIDINRKTFPCKTEMFIRGKEIKAASGYRAPFDILT